MAMKPIAICVLVAFSLASVSVTAKTVTNPPRSTNEQSVNGVAGPPPAKKVASDDKSSVQPSKKALKKTKVRPPPPLHDPN
jgi:hypothetical protein